jgi:hypothetical protein
MRESARTERIVASTSDDSILAVRKMRLGGAISRNRIA